MPHQIIEYSSNLDSSIDIDELVKALHQTASEVEAFPLAGLRTRAVARESCQRDCFRPQATRGQRRSTNHRARSFIR